MLSFSGFGGLRASSLKASGLHTYIYTNLNTLSSLLLYIKEEWQIKMMALVFFIAHEKGFTFHAQPQTGAYSCSDFDQGTHPVVLSTYPNMTPEKTLNQ